MKIETMIVQAGVERNERTGAVSFPVYHSATFRHPALGESTGYDYSRTKNPTRDAVERAIASLEGGTAAFCFSSGMAAITTVLMMFRSGDHVVFTDDLYGGTYRLQRQVLAPLGIEGTFVDTSRIDAVRAAVRDNTVAIFVESPTNPLMKIADIPALAELARSRGALLIVDNTFLTPYFQQPLRLGAHIVVHSATKYLAGHNDVVAGAAVTADETLAERIGFLQNAVGAILGPQDAWLLLRGMKTLALRMDRHQHNAALLARWLQQHPKVRRVYYPGLSDHPGADLLQRQARGCGGMLSFSVDSPDTVRRVLARVKVFSFAESLGGVESLITYPMVQTHADIPAEELVRLGIDDTLLRASVGIEHIDDLIADLDQALGGEE